MKTIKKLIIAAIIIPTAMLFATPVQVHEIGELPQGCQALGSVKIGDTASGYHQRADIFENARKETSALGGNYVTIDVQRVNNAKRGVYFWGWGTAAICK